VQEISAFEAGNDLAVLLDRVELGDEIVITRRGKAVARLVPNIESAHGSHARDAASPSRARVRNSNLGEFEWSARKSDRNSIRP
jgi:prevent-host-death family protein